MVLSAPEHQSDSLKCLRGLKTAHLCAHFSKSNSFLLPWRSVIIEGVIYNRGVWISAPSLSATNQCPVQSEQFPKNRPAATTGHFEERHKREPAKHGGEQWVPGWRGDFFTSNTTNSQWLIMLAHLWSLHTSDPENKQAQTEAAWQTHKTWLFTVLSGPRLPVHSSSLSQYNQFFIPSPVGVAPLWCVQDSDWACQCQCCNSHMNYQLYCVF